MACTNTLFSQTLALISRLVFQKLVHRHKFGRSNRQFGFKEQFTTMAFIQLSARRSMRDAVRSLTTLGKKLYHFGLKSVALSTFRTQIILDQLSFFKISFIFQG